MGTRFAFDLGTSSIGWAIFRTEGKPATPVELIDMGVRLFGDGRNPQTGESLGKDRREPKSARRRRDRTLQRKRFLLDELTKAGLLPAEGPERDQVLASDPYQLRGRGPQERLELYEFGRVLWHLNQRRGFKSNRKADGDANEDGKIAEGSAALCELLEQGGFKTVGQFLAARQSAKNPKDRKSVRIRMRGQGAKAFYDFYPQRAMLEEEFDILWCEQQRHHHCLTHALKARLFDVVFYQRPLKPVVPGRCTFFPDEYRLPRSRELAQEFIILAQLNNLRIDAGDGERALLREERDNLAAPLLAGQKLTWSRVRKLLDLSSSTRINFEDAGEKELACNPIPARFEGTKKKPGPFPDGWLQIPPAQRAAIIEKLDPTMVPGAPMPGVPADDEIVVWATKELELEEEAANRLARVKLPDGHLSISEKAAQAIVPWLREPDEDGNLRTYDKAAKAAGLNHSDFEDGEYFDRLPPYNRIAALQRHIGFGTGDPEDVPDKRFGKIANPTVHIALNQLRRVTNAMIDRYGKPDEIVIEVARDLKQSQKQKDEAKKWNEDNRKANDARRAEMVKRGTIEDGDRRIRDKLLRMRLWEELGAFGGETRCPYTGEMISYALLMSDKVDIDHILPFSRTLDDSLSNKTVSMAWANKLKRNMSPAEAADRLPEVFKRSEMLARVHSMPKNKAWRFEDDAMDKFNRDHRDFVDRQLHATQYLSRLARGYLAKLFPVEDQEENRRSPVWVVTGHLTAKLRRQLGLHLGSHNSKDRNDHRHHAIDAAVIGVTDRSLLQKVATLAGREAEKGVDVDRLIAGLAEPYSGFVDQVFNRAGCLLVAPRPQHGQADPAVPAKTSGKLHEETYYGAVRDISQNAHDLAMGNVVRRKPVADLSANEIDRVRDPVIRAKLQAVKEDAGTDKKVLAAALAEWAEKNGTWRVRVLKPEAGVIPIRDKAGKPYKYVVPAENAFMDIVETPEGEWNGVAVDIYADNTGNGEGWMSLYPDAQFIMRVRKGDTLQLFDEDGENRVKKVQRLEPSANRLRLVDVNQAGDFEKRHKDPEDPLRWDFATVGKLKGRRARRVRFTPAGRLKTIPYGIT